MNSAEQLNSLPDGKAPRTKRWWFGAVGVLLLSGSAIFWGFSSREPRYQNKTAAEWFEQFQMAPSQPGIPARIRERDAAVAGLRALGTNAATYLGREFARRDSAVAIFYTRQFRRLPVGLRQVLPAPPPPRNVVREEIWYLLLILGSSAAPAAPDIIRTMPNADPFTLQLGLSLLGHLHFDQKALDPVLEEWTRQNQFTNVVRVVSEFGVKTPAAAKCLTTVLAGSNAGLRPDCLLLLQRIGPMAAPALPEITKALTDPDDEIRYRAARALEAMGVAARPAIPALIRATNDPSLMVQRASACALQAQTTTW